MSPAVMHLSTGSPPSGTQEWGVTGVTVNSGTFLADTDYRLGRRFTVGATALDLNKLRVYAKEAGTYRVIVHRDSDSVVMAEADIVGVADAWAEATVTAAVLAVSTDYTVSARVITPTLADVYRNPVGGTLTYNAAHTHDSYRYSTSATDTRPTSSVAAVYFWADIGFVT